MLSAELGTAFAHHHLPVCVEVSVHGIFVVIGILFMLVCNYN